MNRAFALLFVLSFFLCRAVAEMNATPLPAAAPTQPVASQASVAVLGYGTLVKNPNGKNLTIAEFKRQMDFLAQQGMRVVSLADFLAWRRGEKSLPSRTCVLLTFDETDAETCAAIHAVISQYRFPAVIFADEKALKGVQRVFLNDLHRLGVAVGSHTLTRPSSHDWQFAALSGADALDKMCHRELGLSAEAVRECSGECIVMAYPHGYTDAAIIDSMALYGYEAGFCAQEGKVRLESPDFRLRRYMVRDDAAFVRAVNFAKESDAAALLSLLRGMALESNPEAYIPAPKEIDIKPAEPAIVPETPAPAVVRQTESKAAALGVEFEDDEEAEEIAEEVQPEEPAVAAGQNVNDAAPVGSLMHRTPEEDWVTARFAAPLVPRDQTRVAVLGYHNFSNTKTVTEMRMRTSEFCEQMQYIHDAGLTVISMQDFLEWLHGERCLPERCVLITLDDGWKSVYTDAYPVMKAYGYPFTLFLYTTYVQVQGDSMSRAQIKEMMDNGATVGSHSAHHYYPRMWKRYGQQSEKYAAQVKTELPDSAETLKQWFGNCSTYCYPGGYNTPPMLEALAASDYEAAFTVIPAKVTIHENPFLVHRYMVFGTDASIFRSAVNFDGEEGMPAVKAGIEAAKETARSFFPAAFETPEHEAKK